MTTHIIDGSKIARKITEEAVQEIKKISSKGHSLKLAVIQVGDSKDAFLYRRSIENMLKKLGIFYDQVLFQADAKERDIVKGIKKLNDDVSITGIMMMSPLPAHLDAIAVMNTIAIDKDVEGRRVLHGIGDRVLSPTALSVLRLIDETKVEVAGKEAVVVGHSDIVGKPIAILLMDKMATVTVCHIKTKNLREKVEQAEILVSAAGKAGLVKGEWIKPGAVVIDVGENMVNGKLVGDVEFETAKTRAGFISPVPGGVGPVTNIMLVKNLLTIYKMKEMQNGNS